ncbi:hypothetical protein BS78_K215400 [Paspalum vaginatum]|uniref:CCHC-type domain-containing protein n=1 Tax=Paspalum vaginatum TaxID=158149 RepID=A0A9W8CF54_9POAL|nr:hypothetical protein BS78_K215400 [Paspalum vaginatum]
MDLPKLDFSHGSVFAQWVQSKLGPGSSVSSATGSFSLLIAIGRCKFRLSEGSVSLILQSVIGNLFNKTTVLELEDRIYKCSVPSKSVGFLIYKLKSFSGDLFRVFFHLWNPKGLGQARLSRNADQGRVYQWTPVLSRKNRNSTPPSASARNAPILGFNCASVGRTSVFECIGPVHAQSSSGHKAFAGTSSNSPSFAEVVKSNRDVPLTGANCVPLGKKSVFTRLGFVQEQIPSELDSTFRVSSGSREFSNFELRQLTSAGKTPTPTAKCSRCLSSNHSRSQCRAAIKCHNCFDKGHIAANCTTLTLGIHQTSASPWATVQDTHRGPKLNPFGPGRFDQSSRKLNEKVEAQEARRIPKATMRWRPLLIPPQSDPSSSTQQTLPATTPPTFPAPPAPAHSMAFQCANPAPFTPFGMTCLNIPHRKQAVRAVVVRPPSRHDNVAIVTITGMPQDVQVTFNAIRGVIEEFLVVHHRIEIIDIQPCHLGQAFVRFVHVHDRDNLINGGLDPFDDIFISFERHNRGRNWRAVTFNQECTLLLLGFDLDYWEREYIENAICSFGRFISWEGDDNHLSRLVVRARVLDLEEVPKFISLTDAEGFEGESWTVQCEILQQEMLGAQPPDEEPVAVENEIDPNVPFHFFGFGQEGHGPQQPNEAQQQDNDQQNIQADNEAQNIADNWDLWPDEIPASVQIPPAPAQVNMVQGQQMDIDLNMALDDPQEMLIHPVQAELEEEPLPQNPPLVQVNEIEEDALPPEEIPPAPMHQEDIVVNLPVFDHPLENFLAEEIPLDQLMEDHMMQGDQLPLEQEDQLLQIGAVQLFQCSQYDPGLAGWIAKKELSQTSMDIWKKHFMTSEKSKITVEIPFIWSDFFLTVLTKPHLFVWAKSFLTSAAWASFQMDPQSIKLSLPENCPFKDPVSPGSNKFSGRSLVIEEEEVRRSDRLKSKKKGYKSPQCISKGCSACTVNPPLLQPSVIRNLGESFCNINTAELSDPKLNLKKPVNPVGRKKDKAEPSASSKDEEQNKTKRAKK